MANPYKPRRKISFVVLVVIGLAIGFAIKRVGIGLIIGLVFGLLASGMISKDKDD